MRITPLLTTCFALLLTAGCGGGGGGDQLTGRVRVDGSSTTYPITEAVAEEFMQEYPRSRVTVSTSGTGGGFSKFLRGETDINNASRPISEGEQQLAEQNNIPFIELPVAYDGLAVIANAENDWLECLTVEELRSIWEPGSDVDNWNQVRSEFPDRPIELYGPGTDSGTYDYFTEVIGGESGASRSDFTASEDDNVLVQGVAGDENALGFFGLAYYESNASRLKLIAVDDEDPTNGEGCIEPTEETVGNNTYQPLSRPLLIYVNDDRVEEEVVSTFVEFYLQNVGELAGQVGYVPLSDEAYDLALQRFQNGTTGSLFEHGAESGVSVEEMLRREQETSRDTTGGAADTAHTDTTVSL